LTTKITAILTLARSNATSRAWEAFASAGLDKITADPKVLTLKGRLLKDQARQAQGETAARLHLQSAKAYADAAALRPDSYPLINAATMSLFAGQADHMTLLAQRVIEMLDTSTGVGETPYWHEATRAEALLLLDRQEEAKAALSKAIVAAPTAWEDRAATLRQFREILQFRDEPSDWLANYAPPASLYFKGLMGVASDDARAAELARVAVNEAQAGFGYGALAAGADILIAEALVERGAELHLVLPLSFQAFRAQSVEPFGAAWLPRFDGLLEQAASVTSVADSERLTNAAIALAVMVAKGAAIENAKRLEGMANGLELNDSPSPGFDAASDRFIALERTAPTAPSDLAKGMIEMTVVSNIGGDDPAGVMPIGDGFHARHTGSLAATIAWLVDLRQVNPDARAALKISADDSAAHFNSDSSAKLLRLAQCADPGTTIADSISARALLSEAPHLRTEPLGELADALGAMDIYAIDPVA